jgi:protein-tyrosine phosphatase
VSLLTPDEESDLELSNEKRETLKQGLEFFSLPIEDRSIPDKEDGVRDTVEHVNQLLSAGKKVAIHCRPCIGRTGFLLPAFARVFSTRRSGRAERRARRSGSGNR